MGAKLATANSIRSHHVDERTRAVGARVLPGGGDGLPIDVARERGTATGLGGGYRKHAAAGADVENAARPAPFEQTVEREQTPARGAVMAGAERQRRFDLDADTVDGDARTIMTPVQEEAAGRHRREPREARGDPVALGKRFERKRISSRLADDIRNKIANSCLIRDRMKIYSDRPGMT